MRECGILMPVSSLPSPYGIGTFSKEAYEFVDRLQEAGQNYWQILPLGPTGYGDSPYQSFSAFAGNPYLIDLGQFIEAGYLTKEECDAVDYGDSEHYIKYDRLAQVRFEILHKAYEGWKESLGKNTDLNAIFEEELMPETVDYCLYAAIKKANDNKNWVQWDEEIRLRKPAALKKFRALLEDEIHFYEFQQMMFLKQWKKLKAYANKKKIQIIGDIPIYVASDSADSWSHPELFQFDADCQPKAVAGCPPDAFSETGQLWGNPLYDWNYHRRTNFAWWMKRMEYSFSLYDVVRIDHFRGFDEYYSIPAKDDTAMNGHWEKGPGMELFSCMKRHFWKLPIIAEDLGFLTPSVYKLLEDTGFPGMKVLQFAFSTDSESDYLPYKYQKNCVVYTGTHDNDTTRGWYETMPENEKQFTIDYMDNADTPAEEISWDFARLALSSPANLAIVPMQDYLCIGKDGRINTPSTLGMNWTWRMLPGEFTPEIAVKCKKLANTYGRGQK